MRKALVRPSRYMVDFRAAAERLSALPGGHLARYVAGLLLGNGPLSDSEMANRLSVVQYQVTRSRMELQSVLSGEPLILDMWSCERLHRTLEQVQASRKSFRECRLGFRFRAVALTIETRSALFKTAQRRTITSRTQLLVFSNNS